MTALVVEAPEYAARLSDRGRAHAATRARAGDGGRHLPTSEASAASTRAPDLRPALLYRRHGACGGCLRAA
jgi:hypothetical protein